MPTNFGTGVLNLLHAMDTFSEQCSKICKEHRIAKQTNYTEIQIMFFKNRSVIYVFSNPLNIMASRRPDNYHNFQAVMNLNDSLKYLDNCNVI